MIIKVRSDFEKARALTLMAEVSVERLRELPSLKYPSNALIDFYDVLHKLMNALAALEGVRFQGEGAHQELIEHIASEYHLKGADRTFLQDLREYRNRIAYEGFFVRPEYVRLNLRRLYVLISLLQKILATRLTSCYRSQSRPGA